MPRLAFEKLPAEKRNQILELAGQEFAQYGFEGASLNRILKAANVSKGAAWMRPGTAQQHLNHDHETLALPVTQLSLSHPRRSALNYLCAAW